MEPQTKNAKSDQETTTVTYKLQSCQFSDTHKLKTLIYMEVVLPLVLETGRQIPEGEIKGDEQIKEEEDVDRLDEAQLLPECLPLPVSRRIPPVADPSYRFSIKTRGEIDGEGTIITCLL